MENLPVSYRNLLMFSRREHFFSASPGKYRDGFGEMK
jgi:hypothetical protein